MPYLVLMYTRSACTYAPGIEFVSSSSTRDKGASEEDEKAEVPPSPSPPVMVILPSWEDVCFRKRSLGGNANAPLVVDDDVDALALDLEDDHDAAPSRLTTAAAGRGTRSLSGVILHS